MEEQEKHVNTLVGTLEKLYTKLARDDASPPKRSAAYILRHNTAETVKQVLTLIGLRNRTLSPLILFS